MSFKAIVTLCAYVISASGVVACSESRTKSAANETPAERDPSTNQPLPKQVHAIAARRQEPLKQEQAFSGRLARDGSSQHSIVLTGTRCYVVIAATNNPGVDLELSLIDPQGVPLVVDQTSSRIARLGFRQPICPLQPAMHRLDVRMRGGEGRFFAQVYSASSL